MGKQWPETCEIGQKGIRLAMPLLQLLGQPTEMTGNHPITLTNQKQGVDIFIKHRLTGQPFYVEIKTEQTWSENLFVELLQNVNTGSPGWFYTVKSHLLMWVFLDNPSGYLMRTNPLQKWVKQNWDKHYIFRPKGLMSVGLCPSWLSVSCGIGPENAQEWHLFDSVDNHQQTLTKMKLL